jgi:hypothetical protein
VPPFLLVTLDAGLTHPTPDFSRNWSNPVASAKIRFQVDTNSPGQSAVHSVNFTWVKKSNKCLMVFQRCANNLACVHFWYETLTPVEKGKPSTICNIL